MLQNYLPFPGNGRPELNFSNRNQSWLTFPFPHLGVMRQDNCSRYLVHGVCILLGKHHVHGVSQLLKLEVARVLAVFLVAGVFSGFLGLLHFEGTGWTPAKPFVPFIVVLLIFIL